MHVIIICIFEILSFWNDLFILGGFDAVHKMEEPIFTE